MKERSFVKYHDGLRPEGTRHKSIVFNTTAVKAKFHKVKREIVEMIDPL